MNQFSCKMKVKICPCFLSACSLWQMKWDEGTAVQWVPGVQFKVAIQVLPFVMFQLYHLVGQNGTHYFGYSASQSVSWGPSGCAALGQADPSCSRAYFVSHSGPRVCAPLLPTAAWWLVMILVLEEQIYQKKDYLPSCLSVALQGPGEPCCCVPKEKILFLCWSKGIVSIFSHVINFLVCLHMIFKIFFPVQFHFDFINWQVATKDGRLEREFSNPFWFVTSLRGYPQKTSGELCLPRRARQLPLKLLLFAAPIF